MSHPTICTGPKQSLVVIIGNVMQAHQGVVSLSPSRGKVSPQDTIQSSFPVQIGIKSLKPQVKCDHKPLMAIFDSDNYEVHNANNLLPTKRL